MNKTITVRKESVTNYLKETFDDVGKITIFGARFFKEVVKTPYEFKEFVKQCYVIGNKSLPLVTITGFIMGLVLTVQPYLATRILRQTWLMLVLIAM